MGPLTTHPPISAVIWPENSLIRNVILALAGTVLLAIFSKVEIPRVVAERFSGLALHVKQALLPFADGPLFDAPVPAAAPTATP